MTSDTRINYAYVWGQWSPGLRDTCRQSRTRTREAKSRETGAIKPQNHKKAKPKKKLVYTKQLIICHVARNAETAAEEEEEREGQDGWRSAAGCSEKARDQRGANQRRGFVSLSPIPGSPPCTNPPRLSQFYSGTVATFLEECA